MKRISPVLKVLATVYLLLLLLAFLFQRRLLFFPTPAPAPGQVGAEEFRWAGGGDPAPELRGWALRPELPEAVVYFGGNAESVEYSLALLDAALPGRAIYLLPYRGYSGNPGSPSEAGIQADALAAFDQLAERHRSVAVIGRSLGSAVATALAARRPVERLVLVTPFDSIQRLAQRQFPVFPMFLLLRDPFESWRNGPEITAPTLVLVAGRDRVVPRARTEGLLQELPAGQTEVVQIPTAGHNDIQEYLEYSRAIRSFFGPAGG